MRLLATWEEIEELHLQATYWERVDEDAAAKAERAHLGTVAKAVSIAVRRGKGRVVWQAADIPKHVPAQAPAPAPLADAP